MPISMVTRVNIPGVRMESERSERKREQGLLTPTHVPLPGMTLDKARLRGPQLRSPAERQESFACRKRRKALALDRKGSWPT